MESGRMQTIAVVAVSNARQLPDKKEFFPARSLATLKCKVMKYLAIFAQSISEELGLKRLQGLDNSSHPRICAPLKAQVLRISEDFSGAKRQWHQKAKRQKQTAS